MPRTKFSHASSMKNWKRSAYSRDYHRKARYVKHPKYISGPSKTFVKHKGMGFTDEYFCQLRYIDTYRFVTATAAQVWNANSVYDPDNSHPLNHQPYYFDQLSTIYLKYQVLKCSLKLEIANQTALNLNVCIGFAKSDPSVFTFNQLQEMPYAKTLQVGFSTGSGLGFMSTAMGIKKFLGHKSIIEIEDLWGLTGGIGFGSNPPELVYMYVAIQSTDGVSAQNTYLRAILDYKVRLFDRKAQLPSLANQSGSGQTGATGFIII